MSGWLDVDMAAEVLGADITSDLDAEAFQSHVESARSFVEDRRPDLFTATTSPQRHHVVAAMMLAYRTYQNRTRPEKELGDSDELLAMLGIGKHRKFGFGGAAVLDDTPVVVP